MYLQLAQIRPHSQFKVCSLMRNNPAGSGPRYLRVHTTSVSSLPPFGSRPGVTWLAHVLNNRPTSVARSNRVSLGPSVQPRSLALTFYSIFWFVLRAPETSKIASGQCPGSL